MSATVLVIEDDEMVAEVVTIALTAEGYRVVHADTVQAGLASAEQQPPDVVVVDLGLANADGGETVAHLRTSSGGAEVPVIVMASRAMPADRVRGYNLGASAYLAKPFTAEELSEKVREAIADGGSAGEVGPDQNV